MVESSKVKKLSKQLEKYTHFEKSTYIIYGSNDALALFDESLETLLESDCFEFDIREYSKHQNSLDLLEDIFELDDYRIINKKTFNALHGNICQKVERFIVAPSRKRWLKKLEQKKARDKK